jgi:hypothetical protein
MSGGLRRAIRVAGLGLLAVAIITELRKPRDARTWHGRIAGVVPYELRPPTLARARERWWNPSDPRLFTEHVFGVGWSVNLAWLSRKLSRGTTPSPVA